MHCVFVYIVLYFLRIIQITIFFCVLSFNIARACRHLSVHPFAFQAGLEGPAAWRGQKKATTVEVLFQTQDYLRTVPDAVQELKAAIQDMLRRPGSPAPTSTFPLFSPDTLHARSPRSKMRSNGARCCAAFMKHWIGLIGGDSFSWQRQRVQHTPTPARYPWTNP